VKDGRAGSRNILPGPATPGLDEIVSKIRIKVWRSLRLFDPAKGSSFSFFAKIIFSTSASIVGECWTRAERFVPLETSLIEKLQTPPGDRYAVEHLEYLCRSLRTTCTLEEELCAQRWYVLSFLDCGFCLRRHECADSAMGVFGLSHARARQLFDLTLLEVRRRVLAGIERRLKPVWPLDIVHSKISALERNAAVLNGEEYTRLCTLMRDLAPSLVYLVKPENAFLEANPRQPGKISSSSFAATQQRGRYSPFEASCAPERRHKNRPKAEKKLYVRMVGRKRREGERDPSVTYHGHRDEQGCLSRGGFSKRISTALRTKLRLRGRYLPLNARCRANVYQICEAESK
jgi:hypothetical protein